MMTLDEAIKHAEEVAEEKKKLYRLCAATESFMFYCDGTKDCRALKNGKNKGCLKCAEEHQQLADWLKELNQLRDQTRWIPVSERLPNRNECIKNNGLFNVSDGNRSYSEWFDIHGKKKFGEHTMAGFRVDNAVTAWMPLPESYKVESE